jgi:HAD superfamily hydrolase (TIGR01457 family)
VRESVTHDFSRLRGIRAFLLDMDGTMYLGERAFPEGFALMDVLKKTGRRHLWLTNNSSRAAGDWAAKLRRMGFTARDEEVYTSTEATLTFLLRQKPRPRIFPMGTEAFEQALERGGCILTSTDPDFVVVGFDLTLTYDKLRRACLFIRAGVPFIAGHPDKVCPTEEGYIPDCGAICACLTEATGVKPRVLGKPHPEMVEGALGRLGAEAHEVAMVGDRLYTDIRMAKDAGILGILVLSGETQVEDLKRSEVRPDYVFGSVSDLAHALAGC